MTQKNEIHQYAKEEGGCNTDAHIDLGILHTKPHSVVTGVFSAEVVRLGECEECEERQEDERGMVHQDGQ